MKTAIFDYFNVSLSLQNFFRYFKHKAKQSILPAEGADQASERPPYWQIFKQVSLA